MKILRGKRALVTGAGSGIGRAIALGLAKEGVHLCLWDINPSSLAESADLARREGVDVFCQPCDVSDPSRVSACVRELLATWGALHLLVNNAGVAYYGPTEQMSDADWQRVLSINLMAPIQITRELLPTLLAQDEAHILNVGSIAGLVAWGKVAAYTVSKFGLEGLSEALRAEYGRSNLGVTSLCPGFVNTNIYRATSSVSPHRMREPAPWLRTTPEHVAAKAIRAIRRNQPLVVVTLLARLSWFLKRLAPNLFLRLFTKRHKPSRVQQRETPPQISRRAA